MEPETKNGTLKLVRIPEGLIWVPARAITLTIPWAWTMLAAPIENRKDFENRSPGFSAINVRGPVWVHNAARWTEGDLAMAFALCGARGLELPSVANILDGNHPTLKRRHIVGIMWLDDRLPPTFYPHNRWHFPNHHGFKVGRTATVTPVECRGNQGFWRVQPLELAQLARQVAARPELAAAIRGHDLAPLDIQ